MNDKKVDNPWSRKKNPTTKPSGTNSAPTPKRGKLSGLDKKSTSASTPTPSTQRKGALARLGSGKPSRATILPTPSTEATSPATSSAGTRLRRPMEQQSASLPATKPKPSSTRPKPSGTRLKSSPQPSSQRIMATRQPLGGESLHESTRAADLKRARRLATHFPPGQRVVVEWDISPAYGTGPGSFEGIVDSYSETGWITVLDQDVKLWMPCAMTRIRAA